MKEFRSCVLEALITECLLDKYSGFHHPNEPIHEDFSQLVNMLHTYKSLINLLSEFPFPLSSQIV